MSILFFNRPFQNSVQKNLLKVNSHQSTRTFSLPLPNSLDLRKT